MTDYTHNKKAVYLTQYHIMWCPKYRRNLLVDDLKIRLEQIIRGVCAETNSTIKALEIMPNHVHLFVSTSYLLPVHKLIKKLKGRSSNLLRTEFPNLRKMETLWTRSFFVSTIGAVSEATIQKYIENQWKK